jgi:hypothetical protein
MAVQKTLQADNNNSDILARTLVQIHQIYILYRYLIKILLLTVKLNVRYIPKLSNYELGKRRASHTAPLSNFHFWFLLLSPYRRKELMDAGEGGDEGRGMRNSEQGKRKKTNLQKKISLSHSSFRSQSDNLS